MIKKCPVDGIDCDFTRDMYDQAYHGKENFFIHHTATNFFSPFIVYTNSEQSTIFMYSTYPNKNHPKHLNLLY